ncbi:AAA family ATPase [Pseudoalteromonas ruthenica]|uniref:AAA family ATPase n=1 Tax=Pseudoalteromonas ruthenica TaxID=151081 RepID=UPI00034D1BB5|nr:AAA family ATPase [Pseudoalteromonas ruthenica]
MQSQILPSRAALAKRIALQFSYGQNLIHLVAAPGFGKSYLLEHFVTDHYEPFSKAYIEVGAKTRDEDVVTHLLEHSFSYPLVDVNETLSDNFYRLVKEQGERQLLWVIDNAKQLSQELIIELEKLAKTAPGVLYILCASSRAELFENAVDIHLEPLSDSESIRLMQSFYKTLPPAEDPIFAEFVRQCHGNPALLLQWHQEQQMPKHTAKPTRRWWLVPSMIVVILIVIGLVYQRDELTVMLPQSENVPVVANDAVFAKQQQPSQGAHEDNMPQPEQASDDNLITEKLENDTQAVVAALQQPAAQAATEQAQPVDEAEPEQRQSVPTNSHTLPYDHHWYNRQDDNLWLWQLTVMSNEQQVEAYIARHNLEKKVRHYQRADKGWHILTWAQPASRSAIDAQLIEIAELLPSLEPYAKQISKIKAEIDSQPNHELR